MIMSSIESPAETFQPVGESLVQYAEVWLPNEDQSELICQASGGRLNASADAVSTRSADGRTVKPGEGLAGSAWKQKTATILQEAPSELMASLNAEVGTSLNAFVAIPLFCQQDIRGVVVLGLNEAHGGVEVWSRDDRDELAVTSGHYSGLPSFEFITRYTRFPKGAGLPGMVWKLGVARLAQNLETSSGFIRSFGKDPAVITSAIGLPVASQRGFPASVLLLLSTQETPLAGMTQLWDCQHEQVEEERVVSITSHETIGGTTSSEICRWQQEVMHHINRDGRPLLLGREQVSLPEGATFCLSLPVCRQADVCSVLNMMF